MGINSRVAKILVVEDEDSLRAELVQNIGNCGYEVTGTSTGKEALDRAKIEKPALIVLDVGLPDMSGFDICSELRDSGCTAFILMLTGFSAVEDRVYGLNTGADDYLKKPFYYPELEARIERILKRSVTLGSDLLKYADLALNTKTGEVTIEEEKIKLRPIDLAVLEYFLRRPEMVLQADDMIRHVWRSDTSVSSESVRTSIMRLRKAMADVSARACIKTVRAVGYMLSS